ncbi:MAG: extracellular solute-binding protein [Candidatus Sumerlaeota bacterium]|nr:extracellular solute-binding protein [Candidatus Sumerlaeota bacterium]
MALISGAAVGVMQWRHKSERPDLLFVIFAKSHYDTYVPAIPKFEKENGVRINMQLVNTRALDTRLKSALMVGAEVPDVVEIVNGSMGYYTTGPMEDIGFVDLTDRIKAEGLDKALVASRFSLWSSRGHIFALPHDVHPMVLAYRRDIVESLGIDVNKLETWDDFVKMGREITKDTNGDGVIDRYALDLSETGAASLQSLLLQRGGEFFNARGEVAFDSEIVADTVCWHVEQLVGDRKIAYSAGWGQPLNKALADGLVLFYFCPDWRAKFFENDVPSLSGKMGLMPFPAWEKGGRRTSTWGGTGIAVAKQCKNFELAWKFVKFLYLEKSELGKRFATNSVLPPLKDAWNLPEFTAPSPYYSNQAVGALFASLAPQTPADYVTAYSNLARNKLDETHANAKIYYKQFGAQGLRDYVMKDLKRNADYVRQFIARNRFLSEDTNNK